PLTEYQPEEVLLNREVSFGRDLIHPGDQARVWEEVQKALRESRPFELTYR
ncbi:MAG: PAS domain-containing protein, partial [Nitrospinaceae bacterium]|nr:PAS domain-containing protein [Nitrospinaceae bacterium]NIR54929.1 PAS domain-containing protein [Nitrospinaceae bacterium]NIS85357.1 PAS domain-containing protein [Nitrospinaceae bacterium]NIT82171.1 PAS domain-containing protein [Nitrospinaceae bacterium]NIU44425.1 PAS domain-containing protein [Nitrospinaceae bacterium]